MVEESILENRSQSKTKNNSPWRLAWEDFQKNRPALIGLIGLTLILIIILSAPILAPYDPLKMDFTQMNQGPNSVHLCGTDDLGRDILSRIIWGGRQTLGVGMLSVLVGLVFGTMIGLISGYAGGWTDEIIQRIVDIMLAFPSILLMLSIVTILGKGLLSIVFAVGLAYIPITARFVRGNILSIKNLEYVEAARALGAPGWWIIFRHILPNILGSLIVFSSMILGGAVLVTAGLNYLGLGAAPPSPEWGAMLNYGRNFLSVAWWMSVFPGAAIFLSSLSIFMIGDGLRDVFDPQARY